MAKAIWRMGLPNIPEAMFETDRVLVALVPATEQPLPLGHDTISSITEATGWIMKWLNMLAQSIQSHKATLVYQEHARKSGTQKNQSGLSATELITKEEKKHEAHQKYGRRSTQWQQSTWQQSTWQQH
jgi:hypothetical protein